MGALNADPAEVAVSRVMATGEVEAALATWIAQIVRAPPPAPSASCPSLAAWEARAFAGIRRLHAIEQARQAPMVDVPCP